MIGMITHCKVPAHVKSVELIFPVTGHSHMPPDRFFVVIEKDIKKKDTIVQPQEYMEIFPQHGAVVKLSSAGCSVYDRRSVIERALLKPGSWHFKFVPSKRLIVYKYKSEAIKVRGEGNYRSDMCVPKSVLKNPI